VRIFASLAEDESLRIFKSLSRNRWLMNGTWISI
jgi:hypothetical protein